MIQVICDICRKVLKNQPIPFCESCLPFAEQYSEARAKIIADGLVQIDAKVEKHRNEFLRSIAPARKLEAVK